jgi:hypothetical protein
MHRMPFDAPETLLKLYNKAPEEALQLMLDGLQTGYLSRGPMPGSEDGLFVALWKKLSPNFRSSEHGISKWDRAEMASIVQQSPKAWMAVTGAEVWLEGTPSLALDALGRMADHLKYMKSRKTQFNSEQLAAPRRWVDEMLQALPETPKVPHDQHLAVLQHAIDLNSPIAIESFLDSSALLKHGPEGERLRWALKNAGNLWPKLLSMGIAEAPVGDRPFWLAVLETAGENGVASPTVVGIEAWAFEHQRWATLEPDVRKRADAWQQKTLPIRLTATRTPLPHLLTWLAHTPAEWHTVEGLQAFPPEKAQALRLLAHQHHHLWEVPAHLGRDGWMEAVAQHPTLAPLTQQTPREDIALRGATVTFINTPNKEHLHALIQALHERGSTSPLPGLWRQAWGHNHMGSIDWNSVFKLLRQPRATGVLAAWKGNPDVEAPHYRDAFLNLFPKTRKFDASNFLRKVYLMEQFEHPLYSPLASQWGGLLTQNKKSPPLDLQAWEALVKQDPAIGEAVTNVAKLKKRDVAALGAFQRALALGNDLPEPVITASPSPRF